MADQRNLSTDYQPEGGAKHPSDTLDKPGNANPVDPAAPLHPGEPNPNLGGKDERD